MTVESLAKQGYVSLYYQGRLVKTGPRDVLALLTKNYPHVGSFQYDNITGAVFADGVSTKFGLQFDY